MVNLSNNLGKAVVIAAQVHENQTDRGGHAYILHPIRLMQRLRTQDEELMTIAILHDSVEDSSGSVTIQHLRDHGFSDRVIRALTLLTHDKNVPYEEYISAISGNMDATLVKIEDLRDNSDITRLKGLRDKDLERVQKYHKAYLFLRGVLEAKRLVGYST